ncbi:hypothetical protein [uncultured Cohaesibacter sp.]|uniref:hypothetical protein n=1 Tax=uncultured Cohaesibacter sp. TaxID=1002546 RepID=UPI002AA6C122|nr:hypothetical protein [uncultured Cohaesibacter sp.]
MSSHLNAIAQRILSARIGSYAEIIANDLTAEAADISVEADLSDGTGSIRLSGDRLLHAHYGDQESAPSGLVVKLLEGLAQQRRNL